MKNQIMYRQGDVLFLSVKSLPGDHKERKSAVIVEGEVTGHAHRLMEGRILETVQGFLFLHVLLTTQVVHEEHHPITLEAGYFQVIRQREYAPEAIRFVID